VLTGLRSRPYLVVLDGFERLLAAYHRFDPSKVRDEEAEAGKRSLIEANADEIVRRLAAAGPSKILISTRLMPFALEGRFGRQMPGVRRLRLPGLTDADTRTLLGRLEVRGSEPAIAGFFGPLGNHPLLVGVVASLVRDYRAAPGDFDRWLADPTAGGALSVPGLDLTQRRTHILAAALNGLEPGPRRLLGWISVLAGSVTWDTLAAINPFQPEPAPQDQVTAWQSSEPVLRARAQLDAALKDLEDRGLVWRLYLALAADQSLTHTQLDEAATRERSWRFRRGLAGLRYELLVRQGEFEQALAAVHEHEHLGRNAGLEVAPAASAFLLAKLGRASEATAAVEESLARFPRIHPAQRPHRDLARALWELGRQPAAAAQPSLAYRQAWADGPPNSNHWDLRDARELLQAMGEPIPDLPVRDPTTVKAPLEDEVRAFIAKLEAENSGTSRRQPRRLAE
jgi:tetratricopeptide (TPR) repeat protein